MGEKGPREFKVNFNGDGTWKAKVDIDMYDALTIIAALIEGFSLDQRDIDNAIELHKEMYDKK